MKITNPVAGQATHVAIDVKGDDPAASGQIPRSIAVKAARGYRIDPLAVAELCTTADAESDSCSGKSRIGGGNAVINISGPFLPGKDYTATADLFLTKPRQRGDIAGLELRYSYDQFRVHAVGRVFRIAAGPLGVETLFDNLDSAASQVPPGYTVTLKSVHLAFGAHHTIKKKRKHKKPKKVQHYLVHNPTRCGGSWPYEIVVSYRSGRRNVIDGSATCRLH